MAIERKKGGRPKKGEENIKTERIVFLTKKADSILISEKAKAMNLSVSEYCNRAIKETEIVAPFSEDEIKEALDKFVDSYKNRCNHKSLNNFKPADIYFGRGDSILKRID